MPCIQKQQRHCIISVPKPFLAPWRGIQMQKMPTTVFLNYFKMVVVLLNIENGLCISLSFFSNSISTANQREHIVITELNTKQRTKCTQSFNRTFKCLLTFLPSKNYQCLKMWESIMLTIKKRMKHLTHCNTLTKLAPHPLTPGEPASAIQLLPSEWENFKNWKRYTTNQ